MVQVVCMLQIKILNIIGILTLTEYKHFFGGKGTHIQKGKIKDFPYLGVLQLNTIMLIAILNAKI